MTSVTTTRDCSRFHFFRCSKDEQIKNEIQKKDTEELYYFIISIARARVSHRLHTHVYNVCTCNCALLLSLFHHFYSGIVVLTVLKKSEKTSPTKWKKRLCENKSRRRTRDENLVRRHLQFSHLTRHRRPGEENRNFERQSVRRRDVCG